MRGVFPTIGAQVGTRLMSVLWIVCAALSVNASGAWAAQGAADYVDVWGPPLDSHLPLLEAVDQHGQPQNLESLAGDQGLLLFLVRSADW